MGPEQLRVDDDDLARNLADHAMHALQRTERGEDVRGALAADRACLDDRLVVRFGEDRQRSARREVRFLDVVANVDERVSCIEPQHACANQHGLADVGREGVKQQIPGSRWLSDAHGPVPSSGHSARLKEVAATPGPGTPGSIKGGAYPQPTRRLGRDVERMLYVPGT